MDNQRINISSFQKKFPRVDFKTLELKPQTNLKFCSFPPPPKTYEPKIDIRYLENDSRYVTPEDRKRYMKEFEDIQRQKELEYQQFIEQDHPIIERNTIIDFEEPEDNHEDNEELLEESDEEDEMDEYEFRSVKKK